LIVSTDSEGGALPYLGKQASLIDRFVYERVLGHQSPGGHPNFPLMATSKSPILKA
jgi:hypothetical protein